MKLKRILFYIIVGCSPLTWADNSAMDIVNETAVTQQDEQKGESYIHQGLANKEYQEACKDGKGKYKDICDEDKYAFGGGGMRKLESLLPALTKAYAMFSMMGGGGGFTAKSMDSSGNQIYTKDGSTDGVTKDTPGASEKTEEKSDYCGYISMVSEAASTAYTVMKNDKTEQNFQESKPETRQAASFYALADSHKTLAKGAKVQYGVWTATAACYVAYATQAAYQGDWKVYAKMAAAAFIAMYYKKKADAHKEREKLLLQMAADLPQAGDCNPFTDKSCFCAEETSFSSDPASFNAVCVPQMLADRNEKNNEAYVCADANGKADEECKCAKTNTCADRRLKIAGMNLGLSPTVMKDPLAAMRPISKGFGDAGVNSAANRNLALAKKTLKKFKPKSGVSLNSKQRDIASTLFKNGIPKAAAAYLAKGSSGGSGGKLPSSAVAGFGGGNLGKSGKYKKVVAEISPKFKRGGGGSNKKSRRGNSYKSFGRKGKKKTSGIHIEDFAQKAEREAEIVNDTSKGIFDIISYRYKMSAWREFSDSMKAEMKKTEN